MGTNAFKANTLNKAAGLLLLIYMSWAASSFYQSQAAAPSAPPSTTSTSGTLSAARRDVVHLRNGQTLSDCKTLGIVGIHLVVKCGVGEEKRTLNRLAIMGYIDTMTLRSGEVVTGEVTFFDGHDFDVKTVDGMRRFPRWKVQSVVFGAIAADETAEELNPPAVLEVDTSQSGIMP